MSQFLLETGRALCIALGVMSPTPESCEMRLLEEFGATYSSPYNSEWPKEWPDRRLCTPIYEYEIYDGTRGANYVCGERAMS